MPDFKKISRLIQAQAKERYVLVENGAPAWVVLSIEDYEELLRAKAQPKSTQPTKSQQAMEAALLSYQSEKEADEWAPCMEVEEKVQSQDPEIYLEDLGEETTQRWDLSTAEEGEEEEFDTIPF